MTRRYYSEEDPEKGVPHRHTRNKIRLLLENDGDPALYENLLAVILKLAEKHPDAVLDALTGILAEQETGPSLLREPRACAPGHSHHGTQYLHAGPSPLREPALG
jgi:hypothetical protein